LNKSALHKLQDLVKEEYKKSSRILAPWLLTVITTLKTEERNQIIEAFESGQFDQEKTGENYWESKYNPISLSPAEMADSIIKLYNQNPEDPYIDYDPLARSYAKIAVGSIIEAINELPIHDESIQINERIEYWTQVKDFI